MIAVWILGTICLVVGLILCIPRYTKFIKCKEYTKGVIIDAENTGASIDEGGLKAYYEYYVDGKRYLKSTGSTNYAVFTVGKECDVKYNPKNPNQSYMRYSGQIMNCIVGTIFAVIGIGIFIFGIFVSILLSTII